MGRFVLQPFRQLLDGRIPVSIRRKALALLSVLAKAEGALVTKDELMAAVWHNGVVEDNALQVQIASLRKLLHADAGLLTTVHGFGYRLAAGPVAARPERQAGCSQSSIRGHPRQCPAGNVRSGRKRTTRRRRRCSRCALFDQARVEIRTAAGARPIGRSSGLLKNAARGNSPVGGAHAIRRREDRSLGLAGAAR